MDAGYMVYSPLSHTHKIAQYLPEETNCDWEYWRDISLEFVDWADVVIQLMLTGWQFSEGCEGERNRAYRDLKPIVFMLPNDILSNFEANFHKYLIVPSNRSAVKSCNQ